MLFWRVIQDISFLNLQISYVDIYKLRDICKLLCMEGVHNRKLYHELNFNFYIGREI